jgi:hypothetical protein
MLQRFLVASAVLLILIASQIFWVRQVRNWVTSLIPSSTWRRRVGIAGLAGYLLLLSYNFPGGARSAEATHLTLRAALIQAPFWCWIVCSLLGFLIAVLFRLADRMARTAHWLYQRVAQAGHALPLPNPVSLARRRFLERTALAMTAAPFVAGAYGAFYERLNLEVSHRRIKIPRLPWAFEGFRIAQLSDVHIGPFMTAEEIQQYVGITNELKPELVALTGDFITWDPSTQAVVVEALAAVKAPFGVYGCLGNHEMWGAVEDSITRLFARRGIRILRSERALIRSGGEAINLLGVDYQTRSPMGPRGQRVVREYLQGVDRLMASDTVNILLSHNPNTFGRAAALGIDLSLAGHTHGGQVTLEFVHPDLSPSRLITPYVRGWFEKPGGQLYVNRGIGTIFVPIRFGAPPEITIFELARS